VQWVATVHMEVEANVVWSGKRWTVIGSCGVSILPIQIFEDVSLVFPFLLYSLPARFIVVSKYNLPCYETLLCAAEHRRVHRSWIYGDLTLQVGSTKEIPYQRSLHTSRVIHPNVEDDDVAFWSRRTSE